MLDDLQRSEGQRGASVALWLRLTIDDPVFVDLFDLVEEDFVFVYQAPRAANKDDQGPRPVARANNLAWRRALMRAGIADFRWHDLRHTWASWHVQAGTPLPTLKELGGWSTFDMVLRYAHLGADHLAADAERIAGPRLAASGTNRSHANRCRQA